MQSGGFTAVAELELPRDAHEALPKQKLDGQPVVSCGALLEWLLAIERHADAAETKQSIRLVQVLWFEQRSGLAAPRVLYRGQGDVALVSVDNAVALCAGVALESEPPVAEQTLPALGAGLDPFEFYRELTSHGVEVATRDVERMSLAGANAQVRLRPAPETGFILGPSLLDAALHACLLLAGRALGRPLSAWGAIDEVFVEGSSEPVCRFELQLRTLTASSAVLDVLLLDLSGREVGRLSGVRFGTPAWHAERCRGLLLQLFRRIIRACVPVSELTDHTPLSALGVTSIDLVRIASHAQDWLGWSPELAEFLSAPTVAGLLELYRAARPAAIETPASLQTLSSIESQLWFLERLTNAAGCYNEGFAWRIHGPIALDALERALQLVQRRHPALRSYFPAEQGKPERRLDWRQCNLELVPTPEVLRNSAPALTRLIEDSVRRPFDLEREPAFRCVLFMHDACDATLVLTAHHMICDAWSLGRVLVPELSATYDALLDNPEAALPGWGDARSELERRTPPADYAAEAAAYYRRELAGVPHVLDFPFDHPRPAQQTHAGAHLRRQLPAARWQALKALACELEVSPFVLGLALYQLLLHRYTRQREFCVGVPLSLRRGTAHERVFGCLVNLGVVRARVDLEHGGLREHCQAVRAALIEMLRFDRFSLGEIVRAVAPERSLSHTPLVQAVFGYRELGAPGLAFAGCEVTPRFVHNGRAKFDLALAIDDFGESAELSLEYATDLLDAGTAERLLGHFEQLLDDVLRRPAAGLGALQLAPRAERQLISASELGAQRDVPAYALGIETLAGYAPETIVLRSETRAMSAAELRTAVSRLSDALRARGIGPGEFVALCLPRGPAWVIAVLAVLEAGAAYAPFDVSQPRARISHGVTRCRARVLITLAGAYRPEPESGVEVIDLAAFERFERGAELRRSAAKRPGQRPVYGIMTSGSTGQPRVAAVAHAGLCNLLAWYTEVLQLTPADNVLLATSVGFDLTQKNLFATLLAGAQLVIDEPQTLDPERLCTLIEREAVSVLNCTPSLAYALVASAAARDLNQLRSLRVLVLGGEPIDAQALRVWTEHPSCQARIINSYGPTECSDVVSACEWRGLTDDIGGPIPNARCRVVDIAGGPAALGVPGELWLSGTPLGLGYLADPDANASKFVRDHGHWYRTGDLVRRGASGELQFLGRIDTQLKIRGYRIEPSEIESVLKSLPGVSDASVVCRTDARGRAALVGYVVPSRPAADGGDELCRELRVLLARALPSYMLPQSLCTIASMPRTTSGKLDRNALPAPRSEARPELEQVAARFAPVAQIWCEVLGVSELAADADFFQLGGHSLAAVELISRLESELGCRLRVAAVFEHPLLGDFAAHVFEQLPASGPTYAIANDQGLAREPAACS